MHIYVKVLKGSECEVAVYDTFFFSNNVKIRYLGSENT